MDERLGRVLRKRVEAYLREAERVLRSAEPGVAWPAVRVRLLPLVTAWRNLLAQHDLGRCRHCDRGFRFSRSQRMRCSVWRTAHAHLGGGWPLDGGQ